MPVFDYAEFPYHIITLGPDGNSTDERLALTVNMRAANAAFDVMVAERPGRVVLLVQRARIIRDSREPERRR